MVVSAQLALWMWAEVWPLAPASLSVLLCLLALAYLSALVPLSVLVCLLARACLSAQVWPSLVCPHVSLSAQACH